MKTPLILTALPLLLLACAQPTPAAKGAAEDAPAAAAASGPVAPVATEAPAGSYSLDKAHASLTFRVSHIGFSHYTARFTAFDAKLDFDPKDISKMAVTATVDPRSLALPSPPPGFENEIRGVDWLDAARYPEMTFKSTAVTLTAPDKARVTGDFTMHGVTRPVTLDVTFNGGYASNPYEHRARLGMSATGTLKRSEFGVSNGVPPPGTTMGVGDDVDIAIEAEFTGPPSAAPAKK